MESIIIFIIISILGSLFSGKNKKKAPQKEQPKPFTAEQNHPVKKLKEISQEMVKEIQKEFQNGSGEPPSRQTPPVTDPRQPAIAEQKPARVEPIDVKRRDAELPSTEKHRGRLATHGGTRKTLTVVEKHDLIPKSQEDFMKGIIMSEILAPPKSKR